MEGLALIIILLTLLITVSRCQLPQSAFTCAGSSMRLSPHEQQIVNKIVNITSPNGIRKAADYVFFYLYTKEHPDEQQIIPDDIESLKKSTFKANRSTKIITHGYLSTKLSPACQGPKNALLYSGDHNIIVVDWNGMQRMWWGWIPLDYWTVSGYIGEVASYVARMINSLENYGMNLEATTLIGHSLGAHVMGIAGYNTKNRVNHIVGLDPALPSFEDKYAGERLSFEDAITVDVIHTNGGACGFSYPIGHYDFYANGGAHQPGCSNNQCSHSRSHELLSEAIFSKDGFYAHRCLDFESVEEGTCIGDVIVIDGSESGLSTRRTAHKGVYYFPTRDSSPYAHNAIPYK